MPVRIRAGNVTPSYFRLMGVAPALGRTFSDDEGEIGNEKKVVLSAGLWQRVFARRSRGRRPRAAPGRPAVHGRGRDAGAVRARRPGRAALARRSPSRPSRSRTTSGTATTTGTWAGSSPAPPLDQAQAQVDALNAANLERFPQYKEPLINAGLPHRGRGASRPPRQATCAPRCTCSWGGALFVLVIGGVNIANLVLVRARCPSQGDGDADRAGRGGAAPRAPARGRRPAPRRLAGAGAGLAGGRGRAARRWVCSTCKDLPYGSEIHLGGASILYTLALAAAIGVAIGVVPLLAVLSVEPGRGLHEEGRCRPARDAARGPPPRPRRRPGGLHLRPARRRRPPAGQLPQGAAGGPRLRGRAGPHRVHRVAPLALHGRGSGARLHGRSAARASAPCPAWRRPAPPTRSRSAAATATA